MESTRQPAPRPRNLSSYENCDQCAECRRVFNGSEPAQHSTCERCGQVVCYNCQGSHKHTPATQAATEADSNETEDNDDYLKPISFRRKPTQALNAEFPLCASHAEAPAKYFCMTCESTICSACSVLEAHINHVKCTFKEVGDTVSKGLKKLEQSLTINLGSVKEFLDQAVPIGEKMAKEYFAVREQIKEAADELIKEIQRKKDALLKEVELQRHEQEKIWEEEIDAMILQIGEAKSLLEEVQRIRGKELAPHQLVPYQDIVRDGKKITEVLAHVGIPAPRKLIFSADPVESISLGITDLIVEQENYISLTLGASKMRLSSSRQNEEQQQRQLVWEVCQRGSKVGELCSPTAVAFTPDQSLVVSEVNNHRLQVFSNSGEPTMVIGQGMLNPKDIAVNQAGKIYVADSSQKAVVVFDPQGRALGHWGREYLKYPRGVSTLPDGKIVVTDKATNIVSIHTPAGDLVSKFGRAQSALDLKEPINVACDSRQRIIVNDLGNKSVKIYDKQGKMLLLIDTVARLPLPEVQGICVDASDNILMSFYRKHAVALFSPDGRYIGLSLNQDDKVRWPAGIATALGAQLAVTETFQNANHYRLALYNLC